MSKPGEGVKARWISARTWAGEHPEVVIMTTAIGAGALALLGGLAAAPDSIPVDFFAVAAQVFPIFLVALAIEQRLVDRLGGSEEQYVRDAARAVDLSAKAHQEYENYNEDNARRLMDSARSQQNVRWAADLGYDVINIPDPDQQPDIEAMARALYRRRRKGEVSLVAIAVGLLLVGETTALTGLIEGGTSGDCVWFLSTLASLVATFVLVTLAAFQDLLPALSDDG